MPEPGEEVYIEVGGRFDGPHTVTAWPGRTPGHVVLRARDEGFMAGGTPFEHWWEDCWADRAEVAA
jgi:glyoxylase-like metal-dependent hydrolase (beta-lactamase superfamily II)